MEFTNLDSSYFSLTFFFILEVLNFVDYGKITTHPVFMSSLFSHLPNDGNYFSLPFFSPIHLSLNHIIRKYYLMKIFCVVMLLLLTLTLLFTYYLTTKIYFVMQKIYIQLCREFFIIMLNLFNSIVRLLIALLDSFIFSLNFSCLYFF